MYGLIPISLDSTTEIKCIAQAIPNGRFYFFTSLLKIPSIKYDFKSFLTVIIYDSQ
jgi:hypothetical protein